MALQQSSTKIKLSAVTQLLTDYINRFKDLTARPEIFRYYERVILLVSALDEIITDNAGNILSWNGAFERKLHFTREEIVGQHVGLFFLPDDRQHGQPATFLERARAYGVATRFGQFVSKDGAAFHASLKAVSVKKRGVVLGFTLTMGVSDPA